MNDNLILALHQAAVRHSQRSRRGEGSNNCWSERVSCQFDLRTGAGNRNSKACSGNLRANLCSDCARRVAGCKIKGNVTRRGNATRPVEFKNLRHTTDSDS